MREEVKKIDTLKEEILKNNFNENYYLTCLIKPETLKAYGWEFWDSNDGCIGVPDDTWYKSGKYYCTFYLENESKRIFGIFDEGRSLSTYEMIDGLEEEINDGIIEIVLN